MHRYSCKLRLLQHGLAKEAETIDDIDLQNIGNNFSDGEGDEDATDADQDKIIDRRKVFVCNAIESIESFRSDVKGCPTSNESLSERRTCIVKSFLSDIAKVKKCARCEG